MLEIRAAVEFSRWFDRLGDRRARTRITMAVDRLAFGNFGDIRSVGQKIYEMRIHYGPGYRVYFTRRGKSVVLLLCGGDKSSQAGDIERAVAISQRQED